MRLCANENLPEDCVLRLRQDGHDVLWIRETSREAGCTPLHRNTVCEPIKNLADGTPSANEAQSRLVASKSKVLEDNLATA
mgnify:CR=1 FL=1